MILRWFGKPKTLYVRTKDQVAIGQAYNEFNEVRSVFYDKSGALHVKYGRASHYVFAPGTTDGYHSIS